MAAGNKQQREALARLKVYEARQQLNSTQRRRRLRDNIGAVAGVVVVASLAGLTQFFYFNGGPGTFTPSPSASEQSVSANLNAPEADTSEYRTWTGSFTFNDSTVVGIALDGANAPQAVAGFVQDYTENYYPGKNCHRLAADLSFIQCGSIDGAGGSDTLFSYGPVENAPADDIYPAGTIAMARISGDGYSNGHQFFIVFADTEFPADGAGGYTVVGQVTSGLDALQALVAAGVDSTTASSDGSGSPLTPVTITGFTIQ